MTRSHTCKHRAKSSTLEITKCCGQSPNPGHQTPVADCFPWPHITMLHIFHTKRLESCPPEPCQQSYRTSARISAPCGCSGRLITWAFPPTQYASGNTHITGHSENLAPSGTHCWHLLDWPCAVISLVIHHAALLHHGRHVRTHRHDTRHKIGEHLRGRQGGVKVKAWVPYKMHMKTLIGRANSMPNAVQRLGTRRCRHHACGT